MDFHYHGIDRMWDADGHYSSVEICAPGNEFEQTKRSRTAYLCTTPIFEVPGRWDDCPIQLHSNCYPSCNAYRAAMREYGTGKLVSPGMSESAYARLEYERCKVCQNIDGQGTGDCPGHF